MVRCKERPSLQSIIRSRSAQLPSASTLQAHCKHTAKYIALKLIWRKGKERKENKNQKQTTRKNTWQEDIVESNMSSSSSSSSIKHQQLFPRKYYVDKQREKKKDKTITITIAKEQNVHNFFIPLYFSSFFVFFIYWLNHPLLA